MMKRSFARVRGCGGACRPTASQQPLHRTVIRVGEAMQVPEQRDAIRQATEVKSLDEAHIRESVRRFEVDGREDMPEHRRVVC